MGSIGGVQLQADRSDGLKRTLVKDVSAGAVRFDRIVEDPSAVAIDIDALRIQISAQVPAVKEGDQVLQALRLGAGVGCAVCAVYGVDLSEI